MSQVVVWNENSVKSAISRNIPAMKPDTVMLQSDNAPQKYRREAAGCGQTLAPIIPKMKESVPTIDITIRGSQNIGKIVTIILDIINVQTSKIVESIIIGSRNSIIIEIMEQCNCMKICIYYIRKIYLSTICIYQNMLFTVMDELFYKNIFLLVILLYTYILIIVLYKYLLCNDNVTQKSYKTTM